MDRARILGTVLALIFVAVGIASATPTISWQPTSLTQTGFAGTQPFTVVQLTSQTAIANLSLRVVPQLAPFVSVSPSSVSSTGKGQPLRVQVMFKFPSTMALGTLQGTVQIITSNPGVLPLPLSVTISILQPTADFIPAFVSPASPDRLQLDPLSGTLFATNEVDAIFRPGVGLQRVESLIATLPGTFIGSDQTSQFFQISVSGSDGATLDYLAQTLESYPEVSFADRHWLARGTSVTPNEWPPSGTLSPAQTYGETLIALPNVWGVHDGRNVDAAILDDGFYSAHVDLAANVRDVGTNLIKSHGTTVAGVLAAVGNNGQGIAGVLWNAQVALYGAGISSLDAQLDGTLQEQRLNQIRQAAHNGRPTVLNFSYVSSQPKAPNYWAFKLLQARRDRKQLLLVAGAGNEQTDFGFDYPAALAKVTPAFHMCNVVAVAAVDSAGVLATGWPNPKEPGSNFGPGISLAAAGTRVYTTVLNSKYDYVNGTSEATPFATGIAALLLAKENNGLSEFQLRDLLIDGSRQAGGLVRTSSGAIASGNFNVLNAKGSFAAVELLKSLVAFGQEKVDLASFSNGLAVVRTVDTSSLKVGIDVIYSTNVGVSDPSAVNIITGPGSSPQSPRAYCVETNHVLQLSATATNIFHGLPGFADASLDLSALTPGDVIFVEVNHYNSNASLQNVFLDSHALNLGIQGLGKAAITPAAIYVLPR